MFPDKDNPALLVELSPREKECIYWTLQGKTAKEVATILSLSPRTVEDYLLSARRKLKVRKIFQFLILS